MLTVAMGHQKEFALGALTVAAGGIFALYWYRRHQKNKPPERWMSIGRVSDLYLYPIKSCQGLKPSELECTLLGGKSGRFRDRMLVVINEEGKFVTGRDYPQMTQISVSEKDGKLRLSSPGQEDGVEFSLDVFEKEPQEVRIWGAAAEGVDCGDEVAAWLSKTVLKSDSGLRLLYHRAEDHGKMINPRITNVLSVIKTDYREKDSGLYSDAVAYHLISEASIRDLNHRISDVTVSHRNFRPNIVISGDALIPYEEDNWDWLKIGDVTFKLLAPCTRCLFTTVDPNTGIKSDRREPLATLQKYRFVRESAKRKVLTSPAMGVYLGARSEGSIRIGDEVMIPAT